MPFPNAKNNNVLWNPYYVIIMFPEILIDLVKRISQFFACLVNRQSTKKSNYCFLTCVLEGFNCFDDIEGHIAYKIFRNLYCFDGRSKRE